MIGWPDASFALLKHYVDQLDYCGPRSRRPCASVLRRFQRFVMARSSTPALSRGVIEAWLRAGDAVSPRSLVIRRAQIVDTFLDWLVARGHLHANPFAELRATCRPAAHARSCPPCSVRIPKQLWHNCDPSRATAAASARHCVTTSNACRPSGTSATRSRTSGSIALRSGEPGPKPSRSMA